MAKVFNRRVRPLVAVLLVLAATSLLAGCSGGKNPSKAMLDLFGIGNTDAERESKIQKEMSRLRGVSPFQLGRTHGQMDARPLALPGGGYRPWSGQEPSESDLIAAEARQRIGEELPLFNGQYDDGFRAGWQNVFNGSNPSLNILDRDKRGLAMRVARRDFELGNFFNPGRYGFDETYTEIYRESWNLAEEAAAPVSGTVGFSDESPNRGD